MVLRSEAAREFELDLRKELQTITESLKGATFVPGVELLQNDKQTRGYVAGARSPSSKI